MIENTNHSTQLLLVPATCVASGAEKEICSLCAATLHATILPATGEHEWDAGKITLQPTPDAQGEKTFSCLHCTAAKTQPVDYIPPEEPAVFYGDIDGDGKVSAADARTTLRASVGLDILTEEQKQLADVDGNGDITAADARLILRYSVGLETAFPCA